MKLLCVEIPLPTRNSENVLGVMVSDTPPIQLLGQAQIAKGTDWNIEFVPASLEWSVLLDPDAESRRQQFAATLAARGADAILFVINSFNWPLAAKLLKALSVISFSDKRPLIIASGSHATSFPAAIFSTNAVDFIIRSGYETSLAQLLNNCTDSSANDARVDNVDSLGILCRDGPRGSEPRRSHDFLVDSLQQISEWPRWDKGLATADTFGFPLEKQLHPINASSLPSFSQEDLKAWLDTVPDVVQSMREPCLWLSLPTDIWSRETLELIGGTALKSIRQHASAPMFAVRATPHDLLRPSVIPSLSVLNIDTVEVIVGGEANKTFSLSNKSVLAQARECVETIKRAGLAAKTKLVCALALPGETLSDSMETVQQSFILAATNSLAGVKYDWWYNVPGSQLYRPSTSSWDDANSTTDAWFLDQSVFNNFNGTINVDERRVLAGSIELARGLHSNIDATGPYLW